MLSGGAGSLQHRGHGLCQDLEIQPKRPAVNVLHVEFHPPLKGYLASTVDLPQTRNTRPNAEPPQMRIPIETVVIPQRKGPRAHEAHVALQDVEKLGNLV